MVSNCKLRCNQASNKGNSIVDDATETAIKIKTLWFCATISHTLDGALSPDMFQSQQAGWLFSELRTLLAERVSAPVYGTPELLLHCAEGFTFHRPTPADGRHPLGLGKRVVSVCGKQCDLSIGEHFDQSASVEGLRRIQSSVALLDQTINDGCFVCWPGSHRAHPALIKGTWRGRSDWVPLTDAELGKLQEQGFERRRVPVRAGDVILWRPDLAHCGASYWSARKF